MYAWLPPGPRLGERHVTDAPGRLDEMFAGDLGIGLPAYAIGEND